MHPNRTSCRTPKTPYSPPQIPTHFTQSHIFLSLTSPQAYTTTRKEINKSAKMRIGTCAENDIPQRVAEAHNKSGESDRKEGVAAEGGSRKGVGSRCESRLGGDGNRRDDVATEGGARGGVVTKPTPKLQTKCTLKPLDLTCPSFNHLPNPTQQHTSFLLHQQHNHK